MIMPNWCSLSKAFDKVHYLKNSIIQSTNILEKLTCCTLDKLYM